MPSYLLRFLRSRLALAEPLARLVCSTAWHGATPEEAALHPCDLGNACPSAFQPLTAAPFQCVLGCSGGDRPLRLLKTRSATTTLLIA
jgi:hypothetical protein